MNRYEAQEAFLGESKQKKLSQKKVAIIGIGALGAHASELCARAGIGTIILIDHDIVELSNLQRQSLFDEKDVHKEKAKVAQKKLSKINSELTIISHAVHLDKSTSHLLESDIVLDCTDNFETRYVINDFCKEKNIPWIHAAAVGSIGTVLPVITHTEFSSSFGHVKKPLTCEDAGILNTASSMTASLQVTEMLKVLLEKNPVKGIIRFNVWTNSFDILKIPKTKKKKNEVESEKLGSFNVRYCKNRGSYIIKPIESKKLNLKKIAHEFETTLVTPIIIIATIDSCQVLIYKHGELSIRLCDDVKLVKKIARKVYEV